MSTGPVGPRHVGPFDPADPVAEAEEVAYLALCKCDDVYGDYPWCPACYPARRGGVS